MDTSSTVLPKSAGGVICKGGAALVCQLHVVTSLRGVSPVDTFPLWVLCLVFFIAIRVGLSAIGITFARHERVFRRRRVSFLFHVNDDGFLFPALRITRQSL